MKPSDGTARHTAPVAPPHRTTGGSDAPAAPDLLSVLRQRAEHDGDRTALEHESVVLSWAELYARVQRARPALPAPTGERNRTGLLASNHPDTAVALLALIANAAEVVLYDARATAAEREQVAELGNVGHWYGASAATEPGGTPAGPLPDTDAHDTSARDTSATAHPGTAATREDGAGPDGAPAFIGLVTSGTGGLPKVVRKSWPVTLANSGAYAESAGYGPEDRLLCTTPLHHAYAFGASLLPALLSGATLVLAPHPPSPAGLARALRESRATVVQTVPFLYRAMLECGEPLEAPDLRFCLSAGEPLPPDLARAWRERVGAPVRNQYGATEFGQIAFAADDPEGPMRLMPGVTARLSDEDGNWLTDKDGRWLADAGPETVGDLHLRQQGAEVDYWGLPELGPAALREGWFRTGDTGRLPGPGLVEVRGRTDRRITVAGRKVDPDEVERAVLSMSGVSECRVSAAPAVPGRTGDAFVAFVAAEPAVTEIELRRHLARLLSPYKVPTRFHLTERLPRTGSGKVHMARLWQGVRA
ncbi:acyl--CoA ligase [Streptomyces sp. P38-E01]|uniref:Acyl--CoA ligase n=1 Tax=Streptomyces tardus TaxID=2780544 RepID=A0A949JIW7_9ACTN|nr:class I adenylate-forming enzyme family protein [Streptomyces tardus]MBU7597084.1 acyl--CoA ligase [Streptomyces tardus]